MKNRPDTVVRNVHGSAKLDGCVKTFSKKKNTTSKSRNILSTRNTSYSTVCYFSIFSKMFVQLNYFLKKGFKLNKGGKRTYNVKMFMSGGLEICYNN